MKVERIIRKLREGKTVSEIARDEKLNRYSVSLIKQTLELIEKEKQTEQETLYNDDKLKDEINKVKDENSKLKEKLNELTEQNKKLNEKSFLECITEHPFELVVYAIIFVIIVVIVKKLSGG